MTFTTAGPYMPAVITAISHPTQDFKLSPTSNTDAHEAKIARMEATAPEGCAGGIPSTIHEGIEPVDDFFSQIS